MRGNPVARHDRIERRQRAERQPEPRGQIKAPRQHAEVEGDQVFIMRPEAEKARDGAGLSVCGDAVDQTGSQLNTSADTSSGMNVALSAGIAWLPTVSAVQPSP